MANTCKTRQRLASIGSMPSDRIFQRNAHEKQALENELARELHNFDMAALQELDEKVLEQQIALQKAGVPGIFPTKDPEQLALQVKIVAAIVEYGKLQLACVFIISSCSKLRHVAINLIRIF